MCFSKSWRKSVSWSAVSWMRGTNTSSRPSLTASASTSQRWKMPSLRDRRLKWWASSWEPMEANISSSSTRSQKSIKIQVRTEKWVNLLDLNIFYSGMEYTEKDWMRLKSTTLPSPTFIYILNNPNALCIISFYSIFVDLNSCYGYYIYSLF